MTEEDEGTDGRRGEEGKEEETTGRNEWEQAGWIERKKLFIP